SWLSIFHRSPVFRSILITAGVGILFGSFIPLENLNYDLLMWLKPSETITNAVLVYVNRETLDLGSEQSRLSRTNYARLLDVLRQEGAGLVFMDVVYDQPSSTHENDEA